VPNTVTEGLPQAAATAQQMLPAISALGLIVAGGVVPVALLAYWVSNSVWTLGQAAVIWRWFPTPGSAAASRSH
jgi:YidC/Oxa1 family membrane protein insertase